MSTLYCHTCNKNVGSDGPTRDIKTIICSTCTPLVVSNEKELRKKCDQYQVYVGQLNREIQELNRKLPDTDIFSLDKKMHG